MQPFTMDLRRSDQSRIDLSYLSEAPAGRDGFVTIKGGHLAKPDGGRLRLWGVNVTDWSPGSVTIPSKEDAPVYAAILARFGFNCVRLHFLDLDAPRGLVDSSRDDSQHLDPAQLDRLDNWIAALKEHGIYCDLNLVVGRSYKAGDAVQDHDRIGWAKALTYFDPRLIELQKSYAEQILTHYNPYTQAEYRHDPAIAIIELVNENSLVEAWHYGSLRSAKSKGSGENVQPLPAYYTLMLDDMYQQYLRQSGSDRLAQLREVAGIEGTDPVPRLNPEEFEAAPAGRFQTETAFYMEIERSFFSDMKSFLREKLGVGQLLLGSNDHMYGQSGYPMVWSNSVLDIIDGHMYWQHPAHASGQNTPMVNDPLHSMIVRLSRTALAGMPFTVSEVNHIFPGDWISEGIPVLAAYASLQDWDAVIWYTFEPKQNPEWKVYVGDTFDLSLDPVRMPQLAAGALAFRRGDVKEASTTIKRTYTLEQVRESLRMSPGERPYYTPGLPLSLALQHKMRVGSLEGPPTEAISTRDANPIVSDTGELAWYTSPEGDGLVTVDTPRSQALIGSLGANNRSVSNLSADVTNRFCAITLSALDAKPIAHAGRLLLTTGARVENTGQEWNETRSEITEFGGPPSLVEPVSGRITLTHLQGATSVHVDALDGAGRAIGEALPAQNTSDGWVIQVGNPVTTWYEITVER